MSGAQHRNRSFIHSSNGIGLMVTVTAHTYQRLYTSSIHSPERNDRMWRHSRYVTREDALNELHSSAQGCLTRTINAAASGLPPARDDIQCISYWPHKG